jgi:hypothetical protein
LQHIVEEGTRLYTGSVYQTDESLLHDGFKGESIDPWQGVHPQVSAIKTHYPMFDEDMPTKIHAVIQVIRSPYDALLSEFNREHGHGRDPHTRVASVDTLQHVFPEWFSRRSRGWRRHVMFWDGPRFWERPEMNTEKSVTSMVLNQPIWGHKWKNHTAPVLILFYEDFIRNFVETTNVMFTFLKHRTLGSVMPPIQDAVVCALKHHVFTNTAKRHHTKPYNPYNDPEGGIVKRKLVAEFCEHVKDYWFEEKWGKCLDAPLQSARNDVTIIQTEHLPKQKCKDDPTPAPTHKEKDKSKDHKSSKKDDHGHG